jgi:hypothetical protein
MLPDLPSATFIVDGISVWLTDRTGATVIDGGHITAHIRVAGLALDQTRRLDDIEDLVLMHIDILLKPAASAQGIFAFAARIGEGHMLGASDTHLCLAINFELVDNTSEYNYGLLVTRLMLEPTRHTIW